MLAGLANIPHTPTEWALWSWDHRNSHDKIRAAIFSKYGLNLTDWPVEPIDPNNMQVFLQNNASLHSDMAGPIGLQTSNLEDANLGNENELVSWIRLHDQEHRDAELKLGI